MADPEGVAYSRRAPPPPPQFRVKIFGPKYAIDLTFFIHLNNLLAREGLLTRRNIS